MVVTARDVQAPRSAAVRTLKTLSRTFPSVGQHLAVLDGLRGIAVLIVILSHASLIDIDMVGIDMSGTGKAGVWLFFVLSSFLLMHQFLQLDASHSLNGRAWARYGWRRLVRIYPLYLVFLLACWLLPVATLMGPMSLGDVLAHLALVEGRWHTWSIAVEVKFYLMLPLLVLAYIHVARRSLAWATVLLAVGVALREWLAPEFDVDALRTYVAIFMVGSWAAIAHHHLSRRQLPVQLRIAAGIAAAALSLLAIAMTPSLWSLIIGKAVALQHWHRSYTLFAALWAALVLCLLHGPRLLQAIFAWVPLRVLGVVSFSAYLWHGIVLANLGWVPAGISPVARAALVFGSIVVVAAASYLLIERPFLVRGQRRAMPGAVVHEVQ